MIEFMSRWTQSIIVGVIITVLIELILPNGSSKKYLKIVLGLYVLSLVISPIMDNSFAVSSISADIENSSAAIQSVSVDLDKSIEKVYKDSISREIKRYIQNCGLDVKSIDIELEIEDEERYGALSKIELTVSVKDKKTVEMIRKVEIKNTDGIEMENNRDTTIFESIGQYLSINYGVNPKNIIINFE